MGCRRTKAHLELRIAIEVEKTIDAGSESINAKVVYEAMAYRNPLRISAKLSAQWLAG